MFDEFKKEIPSEDSTAEEEKMILYNEIKKRKPKVIVETGTHRGLTTMYMLQAVLENKVGHIHTYDPYEWGQRGNFRKFPEHEKLVSFYNEKGTTCDVKNIDFLFIDGYHEKVEVLAEIDAIFPNLKDGAVVFFHDTNGANEFCDVIGAIKERKLKVEWLKTLNGMARYVHKTTLGVDDKNTTHKKAVGKSTKSKRKNIKAKT